MAKFCPNCGAPIAPQVQFCGECGTPVAQTPPPTSPAALVPQPAVPRAKPEKKSKNKPKRKRKGWLIAVIVAAVLVLIGAVLFFGLRDGGFLRGDSSTGSAKALDPVAIESLLDYAKKLEAAGNSEAAAAVYALIPQGVGGEKIGQAHEDVPLIQAADGMEEATDLLGRKGDDAK